jgi:hypothetical protein
MNELPMPLLANSRSDILQRWFQLVVEGYPSGAGRFLASETDRFANPVGQTLRRQCEALLDGLLAGRPPGELGAALDDIVRIRAVQDFTPSQAIGFVFLLKRALREQAGSEPSPELARELVELDGRIDSLACQAFDIYMSCREKIYELRANEIRNRTFKLLERLQGGDDDGDDPNSGQR